jgi:hypothetical protein
MIEFLQEVPAHYWGVIIAMAAMVVGPWWLKRINPSAPSKEEEDRRSNERFSQMIETEEEESLPTTVNREDD